ncbi:MAG: T9SS type A sorting domain-containing protein [Candidatus Latescibacteria bacterium]|nr:T9SS type A sorting domain-containing protein [Candidatus Latescibacterota bacterium]
MKYTGFFVLVFITSISTLFAEDYYVSSTGTATWSQATDINTPCSLNDANINVQAGDTVHLRTGTYDTYIVPGSTGLSDSKRITYTNYKNEQVEVTGTRYAVYIIDKSYISVHGIKFNNCHQFLIIDNGKYNDIGHCMFDRNQYETTWMGSWVHNNSTYNKIHDCTFSRFGWVSDSDDKGAVLDIGYDTSDTDATNYNVIKDNVFFYGGHHILHICGSNNVVRGNYLHNENWMNCDREGGCGNRCAMTIGPMASQNLFEDNRFAFAGIPPDDNGANGLVVRSPNNIVRKNLCYANGAAGIAFASMTVSNPVNNFIYSNTVYRNGYNSFVDHFWTGGISFGNWGNGPMPGNIIVNNILHGNQNSKSITGYGDAGQQNIYNNWMDEGDPGFMDDSIPEDTTDSSLPDFRLKTGSPCIDKGVFLTIITSDTGSGATFTVENAGFFYDSWGIPGETGDTVQLEGRSDTAVIVSIDYTQNSITIDRSLSWTKGQGLSLAYYGSSPDLGAHEFYRTSSGIDIVPKQSGLTGNYPNPFNPNTTICFDLPKQSQVSLRIYSLSGQLVQKLVDGMLSAGSHKVTWHPEYASTGIYLYVLEAQGLRQTDKMVLLK